MMLTKNTYLRSDVLIKHNNSDTKGIDPFNKDGSRDNVVYNVDLFDYIIFNFLLIVSRDLSY